MMFNAAFFSLFLDLSSAPQLWIKWQNNNNNNNNYYYYYSYSYYYYYDYDYDYYYDYDYDDDDDDDDDDYYYYYMNTTWTLSSTYSKPYRYSRALGKHMGNTCRNLWKPQMELGYHIFLLQLSLRFHVEMYINLSMGVHG